MTVLYLGLAVWLATMIVVESELFRPLREWLGEHEQLAGDWVHYWSENPPTVRKYWRRAKWIETAWRKARYLICCNLCAGTWIAMAVAAVTSARPVGGGFVGWALAALTIKGIAHMALVIQRVGERWAR